MLFEQVLGHQTIKQELIHLLTQKKLGHSYLFLGKEGSGNLALAMAFANIIVCQNNGLKQNDEENITDALFKPSPIQAAKSVSDSCGKCPSCIKFEKMIHPDVHFVYPVINKKTDDKVLSKHFLKEWVEFNQQYQFLGNVFDWLSFLESDNKQGNISVAECQEIIKQNQLKSFEGGYKIFIIWMPEYLGLAGNKLLKIIEEPPPKTIFILIAEDSNKILPTILSRTQLFSIPFIALADIQHHLKNNFNLSQEKATRLFYTKAGNYNKILQELQNKENPFLALFKLFLNLVVSKQNTQQLTTCIEQILQLSKEQQKYFLTYAIDTLGNSIHQHINASDITENADEEEMFIYKISQKIPLDNLFAMVNVLEESIGFLERNANNKLLFHALFLRLKNIVEHNNVQVI